MATGGEEKPVKTEEVMEIKCLQCGKCDQNESDPTLNYCVQCVGYLCKPCSKLVHGSEASSSPNHEVISGKKFLAQEGSTDFPVCNVHPQRLMNMFCDDHDRVACNICMQTNHSSCSKRLIPIDDKDLYRPVTQGEAEALQEHLMETLQSLKEHIDATEARKNQFMEQRQQARASVQEMRRRLDRMLDDLERQTLADLEMKRDNMQNVLAEESMTIDQQAEKLRNLVDKYDGSGDPDNATKEFTDAEKETTELFERLQNRPMEHLTFVPDTGILDTLHSFERLMTTCVTRPGPDGEPVDVDPEELLRELGADVTENQQESEDGHVKASEES